MRLSKLFGRTLRQPPADAEMISHQLLVRGAFVRQLSAGVYSYLPLGWRVLRKLEAIVRDEMDRVDGQEIRMPVVNPAELWKETKRWYDIGSELIRFEDRMGRELVLAMTHEEVVTDLARREVNSYRQLPFVAYQIGIKLRDEPRPRAGLVRLREFLMKDAYSFHADQASLDEYYPRMYQAYLNVFERSGLSIAVVEADSGMMGGSGSHEFMLPSPAGEDTLVKCEGCGYSANAEKAEFKKAARPESADGVPAFREVATPGVRTIEDLSKFFSLPKDSFLKTVLYSCDGKLVLAGIAGDLEVNEAKLSKVIQCADPQLASDEALRAAGVPAGYASPVGLRGVTVVLDDSVTRNAGYIAGANSPDTHLVDVSWPRDFEPDFVGDIALAEEGHCCARCGSELKSLRGMELGHTFKLGTKYSGAMGANYLAADGKEYPIIMGCYGIGLDRLMAAVVEQNHDAAGIVWPSSVAPFDVHLVGLSLEDENVSRQVEALYRSLGQAGLDVLFDDRSESAGVKFKDADLMGIPLRVTVSPRTLANGTAEIKLRTEKQASNEPLDSVVQRVKAMLGRG